MCLKELLHSTGEAMLTVNVWMALNYFADVTNNYRANYSLVTRARDGVVCVLIIPITTFSVLILKPVTKRQNL